MTCLCVRMCVCERARSSCGFVFQNAPQSTAAQKDEAPEHELYYITHNAVQGGRWYISMQRWKWEESSWFECSPMFFKLLQVPLSLNLFCPKRENETVLCFDVGKLYCDILLSRLREPHGCTSLSLYRKSRNRFHHRVKRTVQEGREGTVREYRWKSPRRICNVYNVIIYDAARWQPISCEFLMKDWLWGGIHLELWVYKNHSNGYYIYVLFIVLLIGFIFNFFYCYYIILEKKYIVIS